MSKLLDILGGGIVNSISNVVTKISDNKLKKEEGIQEIEQLLISAEEKANEQVTRRWEADAKSGHWLSTNIRPLVLIYLTIVFTILSICDGNLVTFSVGEEYPPIIQTLLITCYAAYFSGRSFEKIKKK